jgi:hypothetical protein
VLDGGEVGSALGGHLGLWTAQRRQGPTAPQALPTPSCAQPAPTAPEAVQTPRPASELLVSPLFSVLKTLLQGRAKLQKCLQYALGQSDCLRVRQSSGIRTAHGSIQLALYEILRHRYGRSYAGSYCPAGTRNVVCVHFPLPWTINGKHLIFRLNFPPNFRLNDLRVLGLGYRV